MRKIILFMVLILIELTLTGYSPEKKTDVNPKNKDVFIRGKLVFSKEKNLPTIKFWIEGDNGNYSLILFDESSKKINDHSENISCLVNTILRENICSSLKYYILTKDIIYFVYDFNNKEIFSIRGVKLFSLGYNIINIIEEKTGGNVSGYIIVANL